ncbi:MAG TPA: hypothetical protein VL981_04380 [Candidatus Methylacidiphilales bacterium]|nr:hypothetical protein [Candidatus Methylacidiphilales bacterium]
MKLKTILLLAPIFAMAASLSCHGQPPSPAEISDAITWFDTLGYPDVKSLPYVRVATGRWTRRNNLPPENRFEEGFLVSEEPGAFTVFLCSVPGLETPWYTVDDPYPALTTVRFVRKTGAPPLQPRRL